jgi:hypothetical protein
MSNREQKRLKDLSNAPRLILRYPLSPRERKELEKKASVKYTPYLTDPPLERLGLVLTAAGLALSAMSREDEQELSKQVNHRLWIKRIQRCLDRKDAEWAFLVLWAYNRLIEEKKDFCPPGFDLQSPMWADVTWEEVR